MDDTFLDSDCTIEHTSLRMPYNVVHARSRSWIIYGLVCLFGIGSWIGINGIWVELPVLVNHAPEGWTLPSYLTVIMQLANIGPLLYALGQRCFPRIVHERTAIFTFLVLGTVACVALCFFWDRTSFIFGQQRSTALILLSFIVSLADCTSTVTFLPFMAIFPSIYMSALYTGESMSGLLPGLLALAQGVDNYKNGKSRNSNSSTVTTDRFEGLNFRPEWFFSFLCIMMIVCASAFILLNYSKYIVRHHVITYSDLVQKRNEGQRLEATSVHRPLLWSSSLMEEEDDDASESFTSVRTLPSLTTTRFLFLLAIQMWINALSNGVISEVQSFACGPYGSNTYHLAVTLSAIGSAMTCFVFMWLSTRSIMVISIWSFVYTVTCAYILLLSIESPHPLLVHHTIGSVLVVGISVLGGISCSYAKLAICSIMRECGRKHLFWCGVAIQIGSFTGAIVMFPIVNMTSIFKK